jgi:hypothetical protein
MKKTITAAGADSGRLRVTWVHHKDNRLLWVGADMGLIERTLKDYPSDMPVLLSVCRQDVISPERIAEGTVSSTRDFLRMLDEGLRAEVEVSPPSELIEVVYRKRFWQWRAAMQSGYAATTHSGREDAAPPRAATAPRSTLLIPKPSILDGIESLFLMRRAEAALREVLCGGGTADREALEILVENLAFWRDQATGEAP